MGAKVNPFLKNVSKKPNIEPHEHELQALTFIFE